jgi:hypothetical protein
MDNFDLRKYLAEGRLLKEDKGINYLKDAFEIYLEGGDDFNKEVGETETVKFENDESLISKEKFKVALQSLPTTVKVDAYSVNFKKVGNDIIGTFKITEGKILKEEVEKISNEKFTIIYDADDMTEYEVFNKLLSDDEAEAAEEDFKILDDDMETFVLDSETPASEILDYASSQEELEDYGLSKYWKFK